MSNFKDRFFSRDGFSLIEVILFTLIGSIILFVTSSLSRNVSSIESFVNLKLQSRSNLEQTFSILATEIRSAAQSSNGAYPIEAATTSSLVFFSDIDQDLVFERVRYTLGTSTILKGVVEPTGNPLVYVTSTEIVKTVIDNVVVGTSTNFLDYFDSNYTGTQAPMISPINLAAVRLVKVTVYVDVNPGKAPKSTLFTETVTVRNLRSN